MCAGKIFNKSSGFSIRKLKENLLINQNVIEFLLKKPNTIFGSIVALDTLIKKVKLSESDFFKSLHQKIFYQGCNLER